MSEFHCARTRTLLGTWEKQLRCVDFLISAFAAGPHVKQNPSQDLTRHWYPWNAHCQAYNITADYRKSLALAILSFRLRQRSVLGKQRVVNHPGRTGRASGTLTSKQHFFNGQQGDRTAVDDSSTISYSDAQSYGSIPGAGIQEFGEGAERFAGYACLQTIN